MQASPNYPVTSNTPRFISHPNLLANFIIFFCFQISCSPSSEPIPPRPTSQSSRPLNTPVSKLSQLQKQKIAQKIWQNECGGTIAGLTTWNPGEEFPSFGIGHFIWYPENFRGPYEESFPRFIQFAKKSGRSDIPNWVLESRHFPYPTKTHFDSYFNEPPLKELRTFLANTTELQADFIIARSQQSLEKILDHASPQSRPAIRTKYYQVASTPNGTYALIDYVNFKGEGTSPTERYQGQGWGLLQVLEEMQATSPGQPAAQEFANAAKRVLSRRIANAPPHRNEQRWKQGWHNRCNTYSKPL